MKKIIKHARYLLEYILVVLFYYGCRCVGMRTSSHLAGCFAAFLGPKLKISHCARRNIQLALNCSKDREDDIIKGMWNNLGRTFGEYPHLSRMDVSQTPFLKITGIDIIEDLQRTPKPIIFFLGHLANWEYATMPVRHMGLDIAQLFRPLNNPYLARFITRVHKKIAPHLVTKGKEGARDMIKLLKSGKHLSMLVDQKLNEGLPIPFFNIPAMTAPAIARLALRFGAPIVPVQVKRQQHQCHVIYHKPLVLNKDHKTDFDTIHDLLTQMNNHLESWIRQQPQDWLWLHKRWPQSY